MNKLIEYCDLKMTATFDPGNFFRYSEYKDWRRFRTMLRTQKYEDAVGLCLKKVSVEEGIRRWTEGTDRSWEKACQMLRKALEKIDTTLVRKVEKQRAILNHIDTCAHRVSVPKKSRIRWGNWLQIENLIKAKKYPEAYEYCQQVNRDAQDNKWNELTELVKNMMTDLASSQV